MSSMVKINRVKTIFDFLYSKQAFLNNQNIGFKNAQNWHFFSKWVSPWFWLKFAILLTFRFLQNKPRKSIWWRSCKKRSLWRQYKHGFNKKAKLEFFAKGIVHDFGQKMKFFHVLCLSKIDRENLFADVLDKKVAVKDYKNNCLRKTPKLEFFQSG